MAASPTAMPSSHLGSMRGGGQLCGSAWVCMVTHSLATVVAVIALVMCLCRCRLRLATGGSACARERRHYACNLRRICALFFARSFLSLSPLAWILFISLPSRVMCGASFCCLAALQTAEGDGEAKCRRGKVQARCDAQRGEREKPRYRSTPRRAHNRQHSLTDERGGGSRKPPDKVARATAGSQP